MVIGSYYIGGYYIMAIGDYYIMAIGGYSIDGYY
jgi:hypothetical protein